MATARDIMKGGLSAGTSKAINGQILPALTGAGTTQATATAASASINVFTTVASGTGGILPACEIGDAVEVCNLGANALTVYPDVGARINALTTNTGVSLATNTSLWLRRFTSTRWMGYLSA